MSASPSRRPVASPSRGSVRSSADGAALPDSPEPRALNTPPAPPTFVARARVAAGRSGVSWHGRRRAAPDSRHGRCGTSCIRTAGHHGQRRKRLHRHKARGGLARAFAAAPVLGLAAASAAADSTARLLTGLSAEAGPAGVRLS